MRRFLLLVVLLSAGLSNAAITIPNTPLIAQQNAKPMTMIVAGRDHRLFYEAYNDASDIDGDGTLDIRFKPNITYFGLFDPNLCYTYSGSGNSGLFSPSSYAVNGKCPGKWSGNWLNYVTTSRIDALRKVLYGGHREVDTATQTILRRAYIPQDAHSWAKEYTSVTVDGYNIADYTPLSVPAAGKRHLFGNLTANAGTNCATLDTCSNLPPLLSVVTNTPKRVWEWASKERPVLDGSHGGTRNDYTVRVEVCTAAFHDGCKQYPNGNYKPVGLLHDYGENEAMLFGLLTGSYDKNMSGGRLRKVVSSFKDEVDPTTGVFTANAKIVQTFNRLRIRDFNNGRTDNAYRGGWVGTRPMNEGEFVDWGNPLAEMLYEALRYFAGKGAPTSAFAGSTTFDNEVGLPTATWDNPYSSTSAAKAPWCARSNLLTISDVNVSFDSDQLPGSAFGTFSGDLGGLNVSTLSDTITTNEPGVAGLHFIGQSGGTYDGAPTAKSVTSLGNIRGLAPEEPTKQGSYYSAAVAYYGKTTDLNPVTGKQTVDAFFVALSSPLPRIEFPTPSGKVTLVPFAKSVGGCLVTEPSFKPTNQIVDFYVDTLANLPGAPSDGSINGGRPYAKFRINFEDVEQGADHDMDAIVEYTIQLTATGQVEVRLDSTYAAGCVIQHMGYVISGTTADGVYLVVRDWDTAESSDVDYALDVPNVPGALPLTSTLTFTPGGGAATLLKDPLWYAAKWGGFIDRNGNNRPDLTSEWDADGDGVPDTYFLVQNPLKLKETLRRTFDNILERNGSAGNVTSNSTSISSDTAVYHSIFNTASWSGDLKAYPVTSSGVGNTPLWKASEHVPTPTSRKIFTRSGGSAVEFTWANLSSSDQTALGSADVVDYLRGERSKELQNGGSFRNRPKNPDNVLGDIVHSSPFYVKDTNTVYVGANDGMLHAFNATTGQELFAYIPSAMIPKLKNLSSPSYTHDYFVDGDIAVSSQSDTGGKNYLVATLGRGGKGLFGLDVTTPGSFAASHVKWECFATGGTVSACNSDNDLGFMLGRPVIAKMNDGNWAVIVGNGYNSSSGKAVLYIFKLDDGTLLKKIDTGVAGDNGLASPGVFDSNGDGKVDFIYAGDLKGNVWKFNVSSANKNQWDVAFKSGSKPQPFFTAKDPSGNPQPITAQVTVAVNDAAGDPHYGKRYLFFGTGSYFRSTDPSDTQKQTWYGLIDEDVRVTSRAELKQRTIQSEGVVAGRSVRAFSPLTANDMVGKRGWYLDFTTQVGERIVTSAKLYRLVKPTLIVSSIIPVVDPCVPGGRGFVNAIDPFTGAALDRSIFDINEDNNFANDQLGTSFIGGFDPNIGMPSEPTIVGDRLVVGGSSGEVASIKVNMGSVQKGRISWREVVLE